ncbi:MAG: hypothetical protein MK132_21215 [Lentisphaerales bacterium]|nr:hypothetical protein [Lentisphaerales bacterium]
MIKLLFICLLAMSASSLQALEVIRENTVAESAIKFEHSDKALSMSWKVNEQKSSKITFNLQPSKTLINSLVLKSSSEEKTILRDVNPEFQLFIGTRESKRAKWMVFFDSPDTRPYSNGSLDLDLKSISISQQKQRATVKFGTISFQDFPESFGLPFTMVLHWLMSKRSFKQK